MQHGDISNEGPPTVMVHLDTITTKTPEMTKTFGLFPRHTEHVDLDMVMANRLYRVSFDLDVTLHCFCTNGWDLDPWEERLDRLNLNPFRYFTSYVTPHELIRDLPYLPGVRGVIDPARTLMYGSYGMDLAQLIR